ncbi:MAG: hypothetical protein K6U78_18770 [Anaerolineae bacterium]|nr:hypothetical protein [Anaerolineae bacterium]
MEAKPADPAKVNGASRAISPAPTISKNALQQRQAKLEAIEQRIQNLEGQLAELSRQMERAGSDYARLQALGEAYRAAERELAAAWAEFEKLA